MKKKALTFVEIAVVLCSLFLVALPTTTIAAGQDEYILGVYGNANEDDTIDMRDLTYEKLIFFGNKPETELADAKYDGKMNPLDFIQIKLIIVDKEKELTLIDSTKRIVTVKKPIERIVVACSDSLELLRAVKLETNRVVGVASGVQSLGPYGTHYKAFFPEYQDKPTVDSQDLESMLRLDPDMIIIWVSPQYGATDETIDLLKSAGIAVVCAYGGREEKDMLEDVKRFGYLFEKEDEADEFIDWYESVVNQIKEKVEEIPEEDKPMVYFEGYKKWYISGEDRDRVGSAGGKNIFEERGIIDAEAVIIRNPEVMVKTPWGCGGYSRDVDDTAELEEIREEITSRPELQKVPAVKGGRVYIISGYITTWGPSAGCRGFLSIAYMAKWFHPELFEDFDPKAIHQEYLTRFQGLDIDLDEKGVFVYPEPN